MQPIIKSLLLAFTMTAASFEAAAHSMNPGYQKIMAVSETTDVTYNITNDFDFPIVLKVDVFQKDGESPAEGWTVDRELFKMVPGNEKRFTVRFDTSEERKVIVCSVLHKVGYDEKDPSIITRVCSRLFLYK